MRPIYYVVAVAVWLVSSIVLAGPSIHLKTGTFSPSKISNLSIPSNLEFSKTNYFIVQFRDSIKPVYEEKLENSGALVLNYIPDQAYVVFMNPLLAQNVNAWPEINWVGAYVPSFRGLSNVIEPSLLVQNESTQLIVSLFDSPDREKAMKAVVSYAENILFRGEKTVILDGKRGIADKLVAVEGVEWVEPYTPMKPIELQLAEEDDPADDIELTGLESGVAFLGLRPIYELGFKGANQVAGIADTGLDLGVNDSTLHPDVAGRLIDAQIYGFFSETWADSNGHGTHVTGSVLGNGTASDGKIAGGAPEASLVFQSLLTGFGTLYIPPELSELFDPAYKLDAHVHSNSWGNASSPGQYETYARSLDEYVWKNPDFLPVFAAGNSGVDADSDGVVDENSMLTPGTAKNNLTVGASEGEVFAGGIQKRWGETKIAENWPAEPIKSDYISDHANGLAAFSSRGPTADGRIKPDIVAPGTNVLSLRSRYEGADVLWGALNELYTFSGGTSMSTPLTSGSMLVLRQYLMDTFKLENISAALLKAVIINSALDLYPGQFGDSDVKEIPVTRPNVHEGWGRVDVASILDRKLLLFDSKDALKTGKSWERSFKVKGEAPLKITLAYSDYPAALNASKTLVNDLDLEVTAPDGSKLFPNQGKEADRVNNVEGIDIANPESGTYQIKVSAYQVPKGPQPFALVISGEGVSLNRRRR